MHVIGRWMLKQIIQIKIYIISKEREMMRETYLSRFGAHTIARFFSFMLVTLLNDAHFSR